MNPKLNYSNVKLNFRNPKLNFRNAKFNFRNANLNFTRSASASIKICIFFVGFRLSLTENSYICNQ